MVVPTPVTVPVAVNDVDAVFMRLVPLVYETRSVVTGMSDGNVTTSLQLVSAGKLFPKLSYTADVSCTVVVVSALEKAAEGSVVNVFVWTVSELYVSILQPEESYVAKLNPLFGTPL